MMRYLVIFLLFTAGVISSRAVDLGGRVISTSGIPLQNAIRTLKSCCEEVSCT